MLFEIDQLNEEETTPQTIGEKHSIWTDIAKELARLQKILSQIKSSHALLEKAAQDKDVFFVNKLGNDCLRLSKQYMFALKRYLDKTDTNEVIFAERDSRLHLQGEILEGNILHIQIPELLPDAVKQGESYRYQEIQKDYIPAFRKLFRELEPITYNEKVVLYFLSSYKKERLMKDHDNFEIKQVIDILAAHILKDDNPKWCSLFMDAKVAEEEKCDLYVVPYRLFTSFLEKNP